MAAGVARDEGPALKANLLVLFTTLLLIGIVLCGAELAVRVSMPNVTAQDVDRRLFRPHAYGASHGWVPNRTGFCFGRTVHIDPDGFLQAAHPAATSVSWLLLGDSVCFGLGVDPDSIFASRLQRELPRVRLWNTAAIGYGVANYAEILPAMLRKDPNIRQVVLFWCLNDLYLSDIRGEMHAVDLPLFAFLRHHVKTYIVLKNLLSDRSKAYFLHDYALYRAGSTELRRTMEILRGMKATLRRRGVPLTVVLLPYEYQLRTREQRYLLPQRLLADECRRSDIRCIDLAPAFLARNGAARDLYLFADGIHFSPLGHRVAFEAMKRELNPAAAGPSPAAH